MGCCALETCQLAWTIAPVLNCKCLKPEGLQYKQVQLRLRSPCAFGTHLFEWQHREWKIGVCCLAAGLWFIGTMCMAIPCMHGTSTPQKDHLKLATEAFKHRNRPGRHRNKLRDGAERRQEWWIVLAWSVIGIKEGSILGRGAVALQPSLKAGTVPNLRARRDTEQR